MLILDGKNLGERHKQLNIKVNEAASNNIDFEKIKNSPEQSDVDKLFKIDLASKLHNIEYIIEVLKSGDPLHISRALKCIWMYEDKHSNFINVDYLHHNIFPLMSMKMKKKMLTTISMYVRNTNRTEAFYNYCLNTKLIKIALKFAMFVSNDLKLELLKNSSVMSNLTYKNDIKNFFGCSFTLLEGYLAAREREPYGGSRSIKLLHKMSYLYFVSNIKYLDMLEKHCSVYPIGSGSILRLGLRISNDIMTKHSDRVLSKPLLYINFLNKSSIIKHAHPDHAKIYAISLIPKNLDDFWYNDFCGSYEFILDLIPAEARFDFIKKIFSDHYPNKPFEMDIKFYSKKYFRYMTAEQKNKWALDQIASENEILGIGKDYKWYKFVKFDIAFDALKKLIMSTPDNNKRNDIIYMFLESAQTQRDLEKVFKYYYDRHNNEHKVTKERFVDWVTGINNIYEFDRNCWDAFNKIYQNLGVYSMSEDEYSFKIDVLIYNIINEIDVHDALKLPIRRKFHFYYFSSQNEKLPKVKQEVVYQWLLQFYLNEIKAIDSEPYDEEVKEQLEKIVSCILDLLRLYGKTEQDIPEVVAKLMELNLKKFKSHQLFDKPFQKTTQNDLLRFLKKDTKLAVENVPLVKGLYHRENLRIFFRKLKVYFANDVCKEYLNFYNENMLRSRNAKQACYAIFHLAEDSFKVDLMIKHAPTQSKINLCEIDETLRNIQEGICVTACFSRPPVPLKNMLMYVKGDYVQYCVNMFYYYSATLPLPLCMEFIEAILDQPVSIQKHGLRIAFMHFNPENLKKLVLHIWNKTKNVSLRLIIYNALYDKIFEECKEAQTALFETLQIITLGLREDDSQEIFTCWESKRLPENIMSDYMDTLWKSLNAMPNNKNKDIRMSNVLGYFCSNIRSIQRQDNIRAIVEEFISGAFNTEESIKANLSTLDLNQCKWDLTSHYITYVQNKEDLDTKMELLKLILTQCSKTLNLVDENKYIMRKLCTEFITKLLCHSLVDIGANEYLNVMFETTLNTLQDLFSIEDIYMLLWEIKMNIALRKALLDINVTFPTVTEEVEKREIVRRDFLSFGKDIAKLIMEFMEKGIYFEIFRSNIQNKLINCAKAAVYLIQGFSVSFEDLLIIVCVALMEFKTKEMYLIALNILPSSYSSQYEEDFKNVLNELKDLNNPEIKCKMYDKFVNSDFIPRAFFQL